MAGASGVMATLSDGIGAGSGREAASERGSENRLMSCQRAVLCVVVGRGARTGVC